MLSLMKRNFGNGAVMLLSNKFLLILMDENEKHLLKENEQHLIAAGMQEDK